MTFISDILISFFFFTSLTSANAPCGKLSQIECRLSPKCNWIESCGASRDCGGHCAPNPQFGLKNFQKRNTSVPDKSFSQSQQKDDSSVSSSRTTQEDQLILLPRNIEKKEIKPVLQSLTGIPLIQKEKDPLQNLTPVEKEKVKKIENWMRLKKNAYEKASLPQTGFRPVSTSFLIDLSGSMEGEPLLAMKESMNSALSALPNGMQFSIFPMSSESDVVWKGAFQWKVNRSKIQKAKDAINYFDDSKLTDSADRLSVALEKAIKSTTEKQDIYIFTDGVFEDCFSKGSFEKKDFVLLASNDTETLVAAIPRDRSRASTGCKGLLKQLAATAKKEKNKKIHLFCLNCGIENQEIDAIKNDIHFVSASVDAESRKKLRKEIMSLMAEKQKIIQTANKREEKK